MSAQAQPGKTPRVTAPALRALKESGRPIVMLTAYDYHSARLVEAAGVDSILVGDSLGMTVLGEASTLPVTMEDMVRATRAVTHAVSRVLVVADMPFMSYQADYAEGMRNAARFLAEAGAQAVKLEGASDDTLVLVEGLTAAGIPVMGHLGLTPQSVNTLGGYKTQGKDAAAAARLMADAVALQDAGAFAVVLECVPAELAQRISALLEIPTIGIGAGAGCDGQVQVFHDILGLGDFLPRHAKRYATLAEEISRAVSAYADDVRDRSFPGEPQSTHLDMDVLAEAEVRYSAEYAEARMEEYLP
ncbi:MAG: 3-methyl-2-oxobutanoate hydroxymethyltransferase [Coriobacteriia bacterium]|nr:3-methyl-2-oxobutanoate hydroxymethyltransferase [Coriobacteriia bacterium]